MTEREYVEHIRKTAAAYLEELGKPPSEDLHELPGRLWRNARDNLSAVTAISLCDAWLAAKGQEDPKPSEGDVVGRE